MLMTKLNSKLNQWKQGLLTRKRIVINETEKNNLITVEGKQYINFSSNDYLGLNKHLKINHAFCQGVEKYGFGAGSASMVSGFTEAHQQLETRFAAWLGVERALYFNSGYLANIGIVNTFSNRSSVIFSDKLCHASILDGIQLSRAKHYRYQHHLIEHLNQLRKKITPNLIISESVFSMEGNIAPIVELSDIANETNAGLVIDDAHGIGILGQNGKGILEHANLNPQQYLCLIVPLGKAFNGVGSMVVGREEVIEATLQFARSYRYTTAMPPAICHALLSSLDVVIQEQWRRDQLRKNIIFFIKATQDRSLPLITADLTPIKSIYIGNHAKGLLLQQKLMQYGFFVSYIRTPTVPINKDRIRISLNCLHTAEQIVKLLDIISEAV